MNSPENSQSHTDPDAGLQNLGDSLDSSQPRDLGAEAKPDVSPRFAEAVDHWLESHLAGQSPSGKDARQVGNYLAAMEADPMPGVPEDLLENTLTYIDQYELDRQAAFQIESKRRLPAIGVSLAELGVIAAMILMGISLILPMLNRNREESRRLACRTNLAAAGIAFGEYAADYNQAMPRGPMTPGEAWWKVGASAQTGQTPRESNSAHLYLLARQGYLNANTLACPDNKQAPRSLSDQLYDWPRYEAVSYSYQNQYTSSPAKFGQHPMLAVLADKNPLFVVRDNTQLYYLAQTNKNLPSRWHQQGQNILLSSGSVQWSSQPIIRGDNIWLVNGIAQYTGHEAPSHPTDAFLVP